MDNLKLQNIAMLIEYNGASFNGFQKQVGSVKTIQGELERALSKFANSKIDITTAGRTDSGVHALYQVINFKSDAKRELNGWIRGVNALLSKDIIINDANYVDDNFDARFSAISRTYHYYLLVQNTQSAILNKKVGWYYSKLNFDDMLEAGSQLIGNLDFSCFRASMCQANTPIRHMTNFNINVKNNILRFEFTANAFLYHMIRNIVGALVYVGNGKLSISDFICLLESKNRKLAPPTFMPDGLYLTYVEYEKQIFKPKTINWPF